MTRGPNFRRGVVIGESRRLIRRLGALEGWQFRTWLARDQDTGRDVVVKITPYQERAEREAAVLIHLRFARYPWRYYAPLIGYDTVRYRRTRFYVLVLRYLSERRFTPLSAYLKRGALPVPLPVLVEKLRRRLRTLHQFGVSHGDLKPGNIMLARHGKRGVSVRLIDFGLSTLNPSTQAKRKDSMALEEIINALGKTNGKAQQAVRDT